MQAVNEEQDLIEYNAAPEGAVAENEGEGNEGEENEVEVQVEVQVEEQVEVQVEVQLEENLGEPPAAAPTINPQASPEDPTPLSLGPDQIQLAGEAGSLVAFAIENVLDPGQEDHNAAVGFLRQNHPRPQEEDFCIAKRFGPFR